MIINIVISIVQQYFESLVAWNCFGMFYIAVFTKKSELYKAVAFMFSALEVLLMMLLVDM
jgi:hypothetical protein